MSEVNEGADRREGELIARGLAVAVDLLYRSGEPNGARIILQELAARKKDLERGPQPALPDGKTKGASA